VLSSWAAQILSLAVPPLKHRKMSRTWFLPPDFTFLPDGELSLGTIIPHPGRPTLALASLDPTTYPDIALPSVATVVEPNHAHSRGSSRSFGFELFAKFLDLASASGTADISRDKYKSFDAVDHEVRSFRRALSEDALQGILALPKVKKYMNSGRFGKRPVYIISGLRVARDSFSVTNAVGSAASVELAASGAIPAGPVPLEVGGAVSGSRGKEVTDGYQTAPGVVFAYRLHAIREKRDGSVESELFSHRTAFFSGEGEDSDDGDLEMECVEVTAHVVNEDLEVEPEFDEYPIGAERCIVFRATG
jgi:hypothetical protein